MLSRIENLVILKTIREILKDESTFEFLDLLDDEILPSNSDAILIIGQFNASMTHFHDKSSDATNLI